MKFLLKYFTPNLKEAWAVAPALLSWGESLRYLNSCVIWITTTSTIYCKSNTSIDDAARGEVFNKLSVQLSRLQN